MNEVDLDLVEPLPLLPLLPDIHDPSEILIQDIGKVKRNRGPGIKWVDIETENHEEIIYESFDDVLAHVDLLNVSKLGEKSKKVFIYKCKFKNCPYKIKFMKRYDARYDSSSTGTHSHIGDTEEGGNSDDNMRGLDILQKKIVKEGFNLGITSIAQILKYFRIQRAKREAQEKFPTDPDKRKLSNYVASLKKKNSELSESVVAGEDAAADKDLVWKRKKGAGRPKKADAESRQIATICNSETWSTAEAIRNGTAAKTDECDSDTEDEEEQVRQNEDMGITTKSVDAVSSTIVVMAEGEGERSTSSSSSSTVSAPRKAATSPLGKRKVMS